jgi:murein DD-endopeptidase MepM/ murein hydrolase activator NlpD
MATYKIKSGDTLSAIAARFHTSVSALANLNGIKNRNLIFAGHNLRLPGHSTKDTFHPAPKPPSHKPTKGTTGPSHPGSSSGIHGSTKLAAAGRAAAMGMGGYQSQGLCATGVSRAIRSAMGISVHGNGNQIDNNLPRNKFKQVNISLAEALKIPGLVLTWEHTSTRLGSIYGHTAITSGDGHTSTSDFIERNTLAGAAHRTGLKIFAPI